MHAVHTSACHAFNSRMLSQVIRQCRRVDAARLEADADDTTVKARSGVSASQCILDNGSVFPVL